MKLWLIDFISGSISGILGTFVGHPLDTIKCRLQVHSKEYGNAFNSVKKIVKEEKLTGLFKGVVPPVMNQFPINAIIYRYLDSKTDYNKGTKYFLSGMWSGFVYVIINTPFELVKCRQQLFREQFLSSKQVIKEIIKADGIIGFYRGFAVSFNRDVFSFGLYFYVYYKLKDYWEQKGNLNNLRLLLAGGLTGVLSWFITYPFDTLKTVIQTDYNNKTLSQLQAYKKLARENNSRFIILFKGLTPTLIRAFITNAVIFYTNEICHTILEKSF